MPQVSVTIAGHTYRMACNEGEEAHLQGLAQGIDERIRTLKQSFGEIGDQRITIMAAITVADELSEARQRIAALEIELAKLQTDASQSQNAKNIWADDVAESIVNAAQRIEAAAHSLNGNADNKIPAK